MGFNGKWNIVAAVKTRIMAEESIFAPKRLKINKWKIRKGSQISIGNVLMLYTDPSDEKKSLQRLKSNKCGVVKELKYKDGDEIAEG